jgi:hypothetical protein
VAYRFGIEPLKIEVLTKISGVSFDEALRGGKTFELDGYRIPYIGKSALIANKKSAGRHKDLADVIPGLNFRSVPANADK